jgi:membrane peptidoglycan carboxypeptidase
MKKNNTDKKIVTPIVSNLFLRILLALIKFNIGLGRILSSSLLFLLKSFFTVGIVITLLGRLIGKLFFKAARYSKKVFFELLKKSQRYGKDVIRYVNHLLVAFKQYGVQKYIFFQKKLKRFCKKTYKSAVVSVHSFSSLIELKKKECIKEIVHFFNKITGTFIRNSKKAKQKIKKPVLTLPSVPTVVVPSFTLPSIHFPSIPVHFSFKKLTAKRFISLTLFGLSLSVFVVLLIQVHTFLSLVPNPKSENDFSLPASTLIYDRNNNLLYSSYDDINRIPVRLSQIPVFLQNAVIAAEDQRFYSHHGIDMISIVEASLYNVTHKNVHGASTLTQQLAKNVFLSGDRNFLRKIKEAVIAIRIENNFTKKQILEMYFNTVSFGGNTSGIEAASQMFFGKSTMNLSKSESVFLASLPVGPTYLLYSQDSKAKQERMEYVLHRMKNLHMISEKEEIAIAKQNLKVNPPIVYKRAPHFVDYILSLLSQKYDKTTIEKGMIVHTTLDLSLQNSIQQTILSYIASEKMNNIQNAAAVVANPSNGDILAMVGSGNYYGEDGGQYNVAVSERQLGSAVKLITYALALETSYKPETPIVDGPVSFKEYPDYHPRNYDGKYHGTLTLKSAFANSYNIPALKVGYQLGLDKIAELGRKMGISEYTFENNSYPLAMVLGGREMQLLHLTQAYGVVANHGKLLTFDGVETITDHSGNMIYKKDITHQTQVLSEKTSAQIYDILSDSKARIPAFGISPQFEFPGVKVGIKTGTSNNDIDNTAFAFTPNLVVGTWMGNNDNTPMYNIASGYVGASAIMHDITKKALENQTIAVSLNPVTH